MEQLKDTSVVTMKPSELKKYNKVRKRKQGFMQLDVTPVQEFLDDPVQYCRANMSYREQIVLNVILDYANRYELIYVTQDTIARKSDSARPWISKTIKKFELMGLMLSSYRHYISCEYKVSSYFFDLENRKRLAPIFPALNNDRKPEPY